MRSALLGTACAIAVVLCASCGCGDVEEAWAIHGSSRDEAAAPGSAPGVLLLGDSLVVGVGQETMAGTLADVSGLEAFVVAISGVSVAHFVDPARIHAAGLSTVTEYANDRGPRLVVLALGNNDARLLTETACDEEHAYRLGAFRASLDEAIEAARASAQCVVLVNVADHWIDEKASSANIGAVNRALSDGAAREPRRIRLADWDAHARGHEAWFAAGDSIHHSAAGKTAYRRFLEAAVADALRDGC